MEEKVCLFGVSEFRRLRQLEEENGRLKRVVAYLSLDQHRLSEALRKKVCGPVHRRELVQWFQRTFAVSGGRACQLAPQLKRALGIDGAGPRINRHCVFGFVIGRMPVRDLAIWGSGSSCVA
ncbi:hypothetical protein PJI16_10775 [Nitrospira sp. MA-1]|nr:hypothetical protein [Nitrospira sp. MA-1]